MNETVPKGLQNPLVVKFAREVKRGVRSTRGVRGGVNARGRRGGTGRGDVSVCRYYQVSSLSSNRENVRAVVCACLFILGVTQTFYLDNG